MKFLATKELGRLNKWLRILGYDTKYLKKDNITSALIKAIREDRILLTRRNDVGEHPGVNIFIIKSDHYHMQLRQVINGLSLLVDKRKMFSRCVLCNSKLTSVHKEKVRHKVPEYVYKTHKIFMKCPECEKIYWEGTHWGKVESIIEKIGDKKPETSAEGGSASGGSNQ